MTTLRQSLAGPGLKRPSGKRTACHGQVLGSNPELLNLVYSAFPYQMGGMLASQQRLLDQRAVLNTPSASARTIFFSTLRHCSAYLQRMGARLAIYQLFHKCPEAFLCKAP